LLDFEVTILEDRPEFADPARFGGARVVAGYIPEALASLTFGWSSYIVVATRGHKLDGDCILAAVKTNAGYIGLLGSRRKAVLIADMLRENGVPEERISAIRTPVGLDLGGRTPAEIALVRHGANHQGTIRPFAVDCLLRAGVADASPTRHYLGLRTSLALSQCYPFPGRPTKQAALKKTTYSLLLALGVLVPVALIGQAPPVPPTYNVLTVFRETVKPGKSGAHDAHEVAWAGAVIAAKNPSGFLAAKAMSGSPESWYISPFATWADYEKSNKAGDDSPALTAIPEEVFFVEGDYLSDGRMMVLTSIPDLGYGGPADLAASRYFSVTRITVRPGHNAEYEEMRRIQKTAHETAKLKDSFSLWRVAAGAPAGTYYQFVARKSLSEIDEKRGNSRRLLPGRARWCRRAEEARRDGVVGDHQFAGRSLCLRSTAEPAPGGVAEGRSGLLGTQAARR
jgi:hypothetical protein